MDAPVAIAPPKQSPGRAEPGRRDYYGCTAVHLSPDAYEHYEGRVECWEASSATAMVCEPTGFRHEYSSRRLGGLVRSIAQARGSATALGGSTDLVQRDAAGERELVLQADETLYMHPESDLPADLYIEVGSDALPDVVLEVDYSTDVRRGRSGTHGKLDDYAAWRLPEIWVEVPDSAWLRRRRRPGLTIFIFEGGRYVKATTSRAFPGWTAAEIHCALNEEKESVETVAALRRAGGALGAAEGTGPDDDPFLRLEREESRREAAAELVRRTVTEAFASRGIPVSAALRQWLAGFDDSSDPAAVIRFAFSCDDADEFLRRIDEMDRV